MKKSNSNTFWVVLFLLKSKCRRIQKTCLEAFLDDRGEPIISSDN